jgi:hypothetical protein
MPARRPLNRSWSRSLTVAVPIRFTDRLERGPATVSRTLPPGTGFRRSFALRYIEEGLDPAASASSSLAGARRHAPLVDFCNRNAPQARPANRRNPVRASTLRACARRAAVTIGFTGSFRSGEAELSRVRDWNRLRLSPSSPAPLGALARVESFAPTRLARTPPVAGLVISMAGGAKSIVRARLAIRSLSRNDSPSGRAFASSREGPPPAPFREERMRSAAPEVPSVAEPPLRGGPFVHTLSPACGVRA